jgi:hypothetical protein
MTEQRYRAVLEVLAGVSVSEVAERFGFLGRRCIGGSAGMARRGWPIGRTVLTGIRLRPAKWWRPRSASCAGRIRGGVSVGWPSSSAEGIARVRCRR